MGLPAYRAAGSADFLASADTLLIEEIRVWRLHQNNGRDCPANIRLGKTLLGETAFPEQDIVQASDPSVILRRTRCLMSRHLRHRKTRAVRTQRAHALRKILVSDQLKNEI